MINAGVQSLFDDFKQMNKPTLTIKVDVSPSKLMDYLSAKILQEIQRVSCYTRLAEVEDLEAEDIYRYLCTLTAMRVWHCQSVTDNTTKPYKSLMRNIAVPVLVYQLLSEIGECYDRDYSLKFEPVYPIVETEILDPAAMLVISDIMSRLERNGMKIVYGLPKDRTGELEFMALRHAEGVVTGYRANHPVYGFFASFFAMKNLEEITGMMCRIVYGCDSDYQTYVSRIMNALNS